MNIKLPISRLLIIKAPRFTLAKMPTYQVHGLTNRTDDNMFLVFLDYDNTDYSVAEKDAKAIQQKFQLGTCLIRCSSIKYKKDNGETVGGWHVIFFSKLPFRKMFEIIDHSRCDESYRKNNGGRQRNKVLRLSQKGDKVAPSFYKLITAKGKYQCSRAHAQLFENLDKKQIIKYISHLDDSEDIELINYLTI